LPLTKSLVELHGGVLEIQSEPGKGTTAIVTLPVRRVLNLREPNAPLRASGRS
jgi:signal transduction histidine kinase